MAQKQISRIPPTYTGDMEQWVRQFSQWVNDIFADIYGILNDLEARITDLGG